MSESEEGAAADDPRLVGSDRVLALLVELAQRPDGASLDDLAVAVNSAKSTVHRALGSLTRSGLATRESLGRYRLGDEFVRLAFSYQESRPESARVMPALRAARGELRRDRTLRGARRRRRGLPRQGRPRRGVGALVLIHRGPQSGPCHGGRQGNPRAPVGDDGRRASVGGRRTPSPSAPRTLSRRTRSGPRTLPS